MREWTPPTPTPEAGQGPWCDDGFGMWWVVADDVWEAVKVVQQHGDGAFPEYFGWHARIERVTIRWVSPERWSEELEIEETAYGDDVGTAEAWKITIVNA